MVGCEFSSELEATSMAQDIYPGMEFGGLISLELDTDVVTTLKEIQAYDSYDLLSEFSGNLGIIFGLSVVTILNPTTGILVKNKRFVFLAHENINVAGYLLQQVSAVVERNTSPGFIDAFNAVG